MTLIEYLGRKLKDDEVLELLEHHAMEVVYRFDRLHENSPDQYTAAARNAGFELCFDETQVLQTIFCHAEPRGGFAAVDRSIVGAPFFESLSVAKAGAVNRGVSFKHNDEVEFLGRHLGWVSFELGKRRLHYEYSLGALSLVTLSLAREDVF
jgi:hypothetical protein